MRILWFQLGEQDYVAVTPQDISASEQRFRTDTAEECGVRRRSCCVCAGARGSGLKEPSPSPTCPTVTAKHEALESCPCSSRQWTQVFPAHHPMATAVVPSTQETLEVQSSSWAWREKASVLPMTATPWLKQHLISYLRIM